MKKLLIVVDYQTDFVNGSLGFKKAVKLEKGIVNKIKLFIKNHDDIFFTMDTHDDAYLNTIEGKKLPIKHAIVNSAGWQLHGEVRKYAKYGTIITKSSFGASKLMTLLTTSKYKQIELVGLVSHMCVLANAVISQTASPNTPIVVYRHLTASFNSKLHQQALNVLKHLHISIK